MPQYVIKTLLYIMVFFLLCSCDSGESNDLPTYGRFPDFLLTDHKGNTIQTEDVRDKVKLVNFIFTNCTEFCPTLTPRMTVIQERLQEQELLGEKAVILSFTVDPEYDTPQQLMIYAEKYGAQYPHWRFITVKPDQLKDVITHNLKLSYGQTKKAYIHIHEDGSNHEHEYGVFHTNRIVLVDRNDMVRFYYDGIADWDPSRIIDNIRELTD